MVQWGSDPKVKEWMKGNPSVVEEIERRRDELSCLSTAELASMAELALGIDVSKIREKLIAGIITAERKS